MLKVNGYFIQYDKSYMCFDVYYHDHTLCMSGFVSLENAVVFCMEWE